LRRAFTALFRRLLQRPTHFQTVPTPLTHLRRLALALALTLMATSAHAQEAAAAKQPDNGTDPSRFSNTAGVQWEHLDLRQGFAIDTVNFSYAQPFGKKSDYNFRLRVPMVRTDVLGNDDFGVGDFSLKVNHVAALAKTHAVILSAEMAFDTAGRTELGTGKNVIKPAIVYAMFLNGGHIFAPAVVHSASVWGDDRRAKVNNTVFDFYYVPHLGNPKFFMTVDPALTLDWTGKKEFASLAVTAGVSTGPVFGGNGQVFIKPTVFAGSDRPASWGVEVGYKVIGF
jgi:hypothetical protein